MIIKTVRVAVLFYHGAKYHADVVLGPYGTGYTLLRSLVLLRYFEIN